MKTALITGVKGFCGNQLEAFLFNQSINVFGIDINISQEDKRHFRVDVKNEKEVFDTINMLLPDFIFHLAGICFSNKPSDYYEVNIKGVLNILESIVLIQNRNKEYNPQIISVGSSAEYGEISEEALPISESCVERPLTHYGISKLAQTRVCLSYWKNYNLRIIIVRPFNIIGPGMPDHLSVSSFARQVAKIENGISKPVIEVGNLETSRDFIGVEPVVKTYWKLANCGAYGEIFNICLGKPVKIKYILEYFLKKSSRKIDIIVSERLLKSFDVKIHYGTNEKLKKITGDDMKFDLEHCLHSIYKFYFDRLSKLRK